tara:strand:- start:1691 stop:1996 length:306 start_codon:yes stop_codon:yes gene_type:complete
MFALDRNLEYGGFERLAVSNTAVGLASIPSNVPIVLVQVDIESNNIRFRADGTNPTATVGTLGQINQVLWMDGNADEWTSFRAIRESSDAVLSVTYWKQAD